MMKKYALLAILSATFAYGQNNTHALFFDDAYPTFYTNPGRPMPHGLVIGMPGLSSLNAGVVFTPASAYDIFRADQTPQQSIDNIIENLGNNERLNISVRHDILAFGFKVSKGFLWFDAGYNVDYNLRIPTTLIRFVRFGNAPHIGQTYVVDDFAVSATAFARTGVGYQYPINEKLTVGLKANYLSGIGNINTRRSRAEIFTDVDVTQITTDFRFETAGVDLFGESEDPVSFLDQMNHGFSIDIGGHYQMSEKWDFAASIVNFGRINWRNQANAHISAGSIEWEGFDYDLSDENPEASFDNYLDSLASALNFESSPIGRYSTYLPARILLGGQYHFTPKHSLGLSYEGALYRASLYHNVGLTYVGRYSKWFHLMGGYSGVGANFKNVSLGMSLNLGPYQIFVMSDNLIDGIDYFNARSTSVRFGMNLCFGDRLGRYPKKVKKKDLPEPKTM